MFGLLSAVSLPVGAILGVAFAPVNQYFVALTIAFGAGCLMFAVTIELYGVQLERIERHHRRGVLEGQMEFVVTVCFAICGSLLYIYVNRWLEGSHSKDEAESDEEEALIHGQRRSLTEDEKAKRAELNWKVGLAIANRERHSFITEQRKSLGDAGFERIAQRKTGEKDGAGVAFSMFIGILADGVPESILIGFLASEGKLSLMFVVSIFIANFPESFASGSLLSAKQTFSNAKIIGLWTVPFVMTGVLSCLACWLVPPQDIETESMRLFAAAIEGLASGMMLAMIGSVMLPEAYTMAHEETAHGDFPGFMCVVGFLFAVSMKVVGGVVTHLGTHGHAGPADSAHALLINGASLWRSHNVSHF